MEYLLSYGLMALIIAVLCLLNWSKNRPARAASDRFGILFLEAREYALGGSTDLPETEPTQDGGVRLRPPAQQPPAVRAALNAGAGAAMAGYDARMEQALRELFQSIGRSGHQKSHYYDYFNTLFTLHRLFLQVCADPQAPLSKEDWADLSRYWGDRSGMTGLVAKRLSAAGRRVLAGEQPQRKEGIG